MKDEFILNLDNFALRCLINTPFINLINEEEKKNRFIDTMDNYISSWYKPNPSEPDIKYFSHESLGTGFDLVIVYSKNILVLPEIHHQRCN